MKKSGNIVRTADVIGKNIIGSDQEKIGKVHELVLDKLSGEVRYAVLAYGGFMGIGSEFYAIPWAVLEYCATDNVFTVTFNKEDIKKAPGFNKDNWPDFADDELDSSTNDFYTTFVHPRDQINNKDI